MSIQPADWSINKGLAWLDAVAKHRADFPLRYPAARDRFHHNRKRGGATVYAFELSHLGRSGYAEQDDKLLAPLADDDLERNATPVRERLRHIHASTEPLSDGTPYLNRSLPAEPDALITDLVSDCTESPAHFEVLRVAMTLSDAQSLLVYGERCATFALINESANWIRLGLIALLAAATGRVAEDAREIVAILPLLWRSAEILDEDPAPIFASLAFISRSPDIPEYIQAFPSRRHRGVDIGGYLEMAADAEGLRYQRQW